MPDPLNGSWSLTDAQCDGASLGINGMVTLTFSGSTVTETDNLSDGCVVTTTLSPATVTATDITATAGTLGCGVECTTDDSCAPGDTGIDSARPSRRVSRNGCTTRAPRSRN